MPEAVIRWLKYLKQFCRHGIGARIECGNIIQFQWPGKYISLVIAALRVSFALIFHFATLFVDYIILYRFMLGALSVVMVSCLFSTMQ